MNPLTKLTASLVLIASGPAIALDAEHIDHRVSEVWELEIDR